MLVVCKNIEPFKKENSNMLESYEFKLGGIYRHCIMGDNSHLVWGCSFNEETFNQCFEDYVPIIKERLNQLPIVTDNKLCTKKAFKEYADVRIYTGYYNGRRTRNIAVFTGIPNKNMFRIFPIGTTKKEALDFAYDCLKELLVGYLSSIDCNRVQWMCTGIPVSMRFNPRPNNIDFQFAQPERYANMMKPLDW